MSQWFGSPWPSAELRAPVCENDRWHIPTPVGSPCIWCIESIDAGDRGIAFPGMVKGDRGWAASEMYAHQECQVRNVLGCSSHLAGGPHDHDVPYREDALRVMEWVNAQ